MIVEIVQLDIDVSDYGLCSLHMAKYCSGLSCVKVIDSDCSLGLNDPH